MSRSSAEPTRPRGLVVALEGLDGVGKTTLAADLAQALGAESLAMPGMPRSVAHGVFLAIGDDPTSRCLFHASCAHALGLKAREFASRGRDVVIDRYWLSSVAYARARGVNVSFDAVEKFIPAPDLTILVTLDEAERCRRLHIRGPTSVDRETMAHGFADRVLAELTRRDRGTPFQSPLLLDGSGLTPSTALSSALAMLGEIRHAPPPAHQES